MSGSGRGRGGSKKIKLPDSFLKISSTAINEQDECVSA